MYTFEEFKKREELPDALPTPYNILKKRYNKIARSRKRNKIARKSRRINRLKG